MKCARPRGVDETLSRPLCVERADCVPAVLSAAHRHGLAARSERRHEPSAMANVVRWGMIGCGDVAEKKSGPAFQKAEGSSLVAVASRSPERARAYAARHGVPRAFDDPFELIASRDVDAIYVATPPSSHLAYALAAARAGKAAYVEKPMALDTSECDAMVDAFLMDALPKYRPG